MKLVRCANTKGLQQKQLKLGQAYFLDERSIVRHDDGFEYADIYEDKLYLHPVGTFEVYRFHDSIISIEKWESPRR